MSDAERDAARLDFLDRVKDATFQSLNADVRIAAVSLFTIPSQRVRGNTAREAIDAAMEAERAEKV